MLSRSPSEKPGKCVPRLAQVIQLSLGTLSHLVAFHPRRTLLHLLADVSPVPLISRGVSGDDHGNDSLCDFLRVRSLTNSGRRSQLFAIPRLSFCESSNQALSILFASGPPSNAARSDDKSCVVLGRYSVQQHWKEIRIS